MSKKRTEVTSDAYGIIAIETSEPDRYAYSDSIPIYEGTTLSTTDRLIQSLQGFGTATFDFNTFNITFEVRAPDLWELRGIVEEIAQCILSEGMDLPISRDRIEELTEHLCLVDYMAGQICMLDKGHEGDHR